MNANCHFESESSRWQAVTQRNPAANGKFVYAVTTTGIYCRPACPSRMPNRENVRFFDCWQMAQTAGFRPCKRCTPQISQVPDATVEIIARACRLIESAERELSLTCLAKAVGLSPYYLHRRFKKVVGVTPKQYAMENRSTRARSYLQQDFAIADAAYEAGYESSSQFYKMAADSLGMKPSVYQKGGGKMSIRYAIVRSYLGWVLVAMTERGICKIDLDDSRAVLEARLKAEFPEAKLQGDAPEFEEIISQTLTFLETPERNFELPLDIQGTAFQRQIWAKLQSIPPGSTVSYAELAKQIGNPKAARAVARACAANHIAVAIPCHRVVRGDGNLAGYRWGIERKQALLARESSGSTSP